MAEKRAGGGRGGSSGGGRGGGKKGDQPEPTDAQGRLSVLVEMRATPGGSRAFAATEAEGIDAPNFEVDPNFEAVPMGRGEGQEELGAPTETFLVRGTVKNEGDIEKLRERPEVVDVWLDTPIAPFQFDMPEPQVGEGMAACPIPPCDCSPGTPRGTIADVATYLGVNQIWAAGFRGAGIVVGVLDSGITAQGRPVKSGETSRRIPRVIDGWPSDWGTESSQWGDHGNMCATDVLGMAPDAQLYDFRIAGAGGSPGTISRALQAFQWAIDRHKVDGTPHVLTNSWGIFQETWDSTYARNPNHPFTRKVVEAIDEGILVLFAAGNCGDTCPDGRCGPDVGPGRSIWGANGHPRVMTVGAVNKNEEFIGYSSRGPAALDPNKPDFCGISHFTGYFNSDSGTSAATPIVAGVVALLKQAVPALTQERAKDCLKNTAKDIGPAGFDQHSGSGIVQGKAAFDCVRRPVLVTVGPGCPTITLGPPCPPKTLGPPCPPRTIGPPCPIPATLRCPPETLRCPPVTLRCPPATLRCPPRTIGPPCPTPIQTLRCPPETLRCPTVTMRCPPRTIGPPCPVATAVPACGPPVTVGCPGPDPFGGWYDPYGWYGYGEWDPYAGAEYGYSEWDPYSWPGEYWHGDDPSGEGYE